MEITADAIRTAALDYNRDYPEAEAFILAGTPTLRVCASPADANGKAYRYVIECVVVNGDGNAGTELRTNVVEYRRDGREHMIDRSERIARRAFPVSADVPVVVVDSHR